MAFIAAPVATFFTGLGAAAGMTSAAAMTLGAVAGKVAIGVVTGAVLGAATAALTGGDILSGALMGAAFGGLSAGVMSGISIASGAVTPEAMLSGWGVDTGTQVGTQAQAGAASIGSDFAGINADIGPGTATPSTATSVRPGMTGPSGVPTTTPTVTPPPTEEPGFLSDLLKSESGSKILAESLGGAAKAMLTESEEPESTEEMLAAYQKMNVPGEFQATVANIQIPEHWNNYSVLQPVQTPTMTKAGTTQKAKATPTGLLAMGA